MVITATAVPIEPIEAAAQLPRNSDQSSSIPAKADPKRATIERIKGAAHLPHGSKRVTIDEIGKAAHLPHNSSCWTAPHKEKAQKAINAKSIMQITRRNCRKKKHRN